MDFRREFLWSLALVFLSVVSFLLGIVAIALETPVVLVGVIVGFITNKFPEWANWRLTRLFF